MAAFGTWTLTNFGDNITAQAWATSGYLQVTSVVGGSGFPGGSDNIKTYTTLKTPVLNATITGINNLAPTYLTVRSFFSSASPANWIGTPAAFNLNEIGIFGKLGPSGTAGLIAYTTVGSNTGDTVTPTGGGVAVIKDFALQIQFTQAIISSGTIQLVQVVGLHAGTHTQPTGVDPVPVSGTQISGQWSTGLVPIPDGTGTGALVNTRPVSYSHGICPAGVVLNFAGNVLPTGWLWSDGSSLLRASYPALFTALGSGAIWGVADGTHFNIPNAQGRTSVGANATTFVIGATGGNVNTTLATANLPVHAHTIYDPGHDHNARYAGDQNNVAPGWCGACYDHVHTVSDTGHVHAAWSADAGHIHGVTQSPHNHGYVNPVGEGLNVQSGFGQSIYNPLGSAQTANANAVISINTGYASITTGIYTGYASISSGYSNWFGNANGKVPNYYIPIALNFSTTGITGTNNTGSSTPVNTMNPYVVFNKIIYTGL